MFVFPHVESAHHCLAMPSVPCLVLEIKRSTASSGVFCALCPRHRVTWRIHVLPSPSPFSLGGRRTLRANSKLEKISLGAPSKGLTQSHPLPGPLGSRDSPQTVPQTLTVPWTLQRPSPILSQFHLFTSSWCSHAKHTHRGPCSWATALRKADAYRKSHRESGAPSLDSRRLFHSV